MRERRINRKSLCLIRGQFSKLGVARLKTRSRSRSRSRTSLLLPLEYTLGTMTNKTAHDHRHDVNLLAIAHETMLAEGFSPDIPTAVENELRQIDDGPLTSDSTVRDLRKLLWSSIDNLTSRDLDQVEFVERQADDSIRVLIGIADVAAFVPEGSAIDSHAFENTTSVYTGVTTFPMLPEELSTDKTSLLDGQDRRAIVIEFIVTSDGGVNAQDVFPALVHNYSKMSYEVIGNWLDHDTAVPKEVSRVPNLEEQVRLQFEAATRLLEARRIQGALYLETIQPTPVIDENGRITDLSVDERNSARDIIENFMIAANASMAEFLDRRGVAALRRVVRTPENWPRIVEIAKELNETLPPEPGIQALSNFLDRRRKLDPDHFADLSLAVVKLLGPGDYVVQVPGQPSEGHFGLAVHRYTHSTAPNRRYADLTIQRLLKSSIADDGTRYTVKELNKIADQCNDRESAARKVERKMRKVAAAVLMEDRIGQEFNAIVTGATPKGTFARILKPPVDGMVVKSEHHLKVGQHTRLKLLSTDPRRGFIDFAAI
jgi:VacB/RNase II family 3'-5' exoribonuclease